jgi:uncharacterized membrane protein YedE/YeeE
MKPNRAHHLAALGSGLLFGSGLLLSGMTNPQKVIGFLDPFGAFDASLIFVMAGAIAVHFSAYRWTKRRTAPLFAPKFLVPSRRDIDAKLLVGAALFGAGWGLGGYCPGPAVVSLPGGAAQTLVFVVAMLAGMFATAKLEAYSAKRKAGPARSAPRSAVPAEVAPHSPAANSLGGTS